MPRRLRLPLPDRPLGRARLGLVLLCPMLLALVPGRAPAADLSAWSHEQSLRMDRPQGAKLALPDATLDRARPDLADLRVLNAQGDEVPYAILRPGPASPTPLAPKGFRAELREGQTLLIVETGTDQPLVSVTLTTSARAFVKPVDLAVSTDGDTWETIAQAVPIYRQGADSQLTLSLADRRAAWVRITIQDSRSAPVAFAGVTLTAGASRAAPTWSVPVLIRDRTETGSQTVLTLDLGAAHLPLTALDLRVADRLFRRPVRVSTRAWQDGGVVERTLASGEIARFPIDEALGLAAERLTLPLPGSPTPSRELRVHVDNGDNPPLGPIEVSANRRPVLLVLAGPATRLLVGNPRASAPNYDLATLSASFPELPLLPSPAVGEIPGVAAEGTVFGPLTPNPVYQKQDPFAAVWSDGAPLEPRTWAGTKAVQITTPGIQRLELDREVLATARHDLSDVRLVRNHRQVPYVLERSSREGQLTLTPVIDNDPERPRLGRWKLAVPKNLPITRLTLTSQQPLFQRFLQLMDTPADPRVTSRHRLLAAETWTRTPESVDRPYSLTLASPPQGDTLILEVDNGDNAPLVLDQVVAWYPAVRLLFRAEDTTPLSLVYGDRSLAPPRYDVSLVAAELLRAETAEARFAEPAQETFTPPPAPSKPSRLAFWIALGAVVVALLSVIRRLAPKPPAGPAA